jgi:hypothetical protein
VLFAYEMAVTAAGPKGDSPSVNGIAVAAYMTLIIPQSLIWIGGLLFFGIAALLVNSGYRATKAE